VVKCKKPLRGDEIKVEQTKKEHLSFSFIEVFTGAAQSTGGPTTSPGRGTYNVPANTKGGLN